MTERETVILESRGRVGKVTLNRPEARNALSRQLTEELAAVLADLEADSAVSAILLAGAGKHFAAGADIQEMATLSTNDLLTCDFTGCCTDLADISKPVIAVVHGAALGGGCELVEMCDIVLAADNAVFGHPEITLGTMPGAGGTQRLMRAVGKATAMAMLLSGQPISAAEAQAAGLVSRVVGIDRLEEEAWALADRVASFPLDALRLMKKAAMAAHRLPLPDGLEYERRLFHRGFATDARHEGMAAFLEKRAPRWHAEESLSQPAATSG